jgi:hypothetical protein
MFAFRHIYGRLGLLLALTMLVSACADSTSTPVSVQGFAPEQKSAIHVTDVSAEAKPGVIVAQYDLDRISQRVKAAIQKDFPSVIADAGAPEVPSATKIKLVITQYDEGSAFARLMLAGMGQIKLDADVLFVDAATGQVVARYQVSKQFAFGGIYGGTTRMQDVEEGFAKSVAEIFREKKA